MMRQMYNPNPSPTPVPLWTLIPLTRWKRSQIGGLWVEVQFARPRARHIQHIVHQPLQLGYLMVGLRKFLEHERRLLAELLRHSVIFVQQFLQAPPRQLKVELDVGERRFQFVAGYGQEGIHLLLGL